MGVKLVNNIPRIQKEIKGQLARGINNAYEFWVNEAQNLAPVDTGFLKANIKQTVIATPDSLHGEVRSLAPYSGYVNYGTSRQAPQPFWTTAALLTKQRFVQLLKGESGGRTSLGGLISGVRFR